MEATVHSGVCGVLEHYGIHPILVDVGAAGSPPAVWNTIAPHAIYMGFDLTLKKCKDTAQGNYFRSITINEAITNVKKSKHVPFYLTKATYCSSTLRPNLKLLSNFIFADLFMVKCKRQVRATTLNAVLDRFSLNKIDWLKSDSQGTDLRIFNSVRRSVQSHILALDMEPGFINAYQGEDLFIDIHKNLIHQDFWLSDINVCGTVRMRKSTLDKVEKDEPVINDTFIKRNLKKTPCWSEIRYFRTLDYLARNNFSKREYVLLWIFSMLDSQLGFALDIVFEYKKLFGEDDILHKMKDETLFQIRRLQPLDAQSCSSVAIFGSGEKGKQVYEYFHKNNIDVLCFIDNNREKWGNKINDVEILAPDYSEEIAKKVDAIVIASQWEREIYFQLKRMNIESVHFSFFK